MTVSTGLIMGLVKLPQGEDGSWEIQVSRKPEYSKLPLSQFPVTVGTNRPGIGVTLCYGNYCCEASLHRALTGGFYIGSAKGRLGPRYTALYNTFLTNSGLRVVK